METLISRVKSLPDCEVYPSSGLLPALEKGHVLPEEVNRFYQLCGGMTLFRDADFEIEIVKPEEVKLANPIIVGERCEDDISSSWYIIAKDCDSQYLTIDFNKDRLGRCYESFTDSHGLVGDCPIIARSFTELLEQFLIAKGQYCYWTDKSFVPLGDAYD